MRQMVLSEEARERLADIVDLQPTKNADLQDRWGLDTGSAVHQYLEAELKEYYFRNEDSRICATPEAEALVNGETVDGPVVRASALERAVLETLPAPDEDPQSVVSTLHALQADGHEHDVDAVRSALHSLAERGAVERVRTTVPTFRLAVPRADLEVQDAPS